MEQAKRTDRNRQQTNRPLAVRHGCDATFLPGSRGILAGARRDVADSQEIIF
jgi:hypothetical protein